MPMRLDETLIKDAETDFRQEGERAATRLAISFLMAREARRDPMFLTEVCGRFEKEIAELGFNLDHVNMDGALVMSRRYFQLMVLTAEIMAEVERMEALRVPAASCNLTSCVYPPPMPMPAS
jgi:hypothetical protein